MIPLGSSYADNLPELCLPWQAEDSPSPDLVVLNEPLAMRLGLDPQWLRSPDGVQFLLGHKLPDTARPVAQRYAGHQFGGYSPRLGDGRALLLGEITTSDGELRDVHLKGSGATPFARAGDGRAVLGPMLRELLISESMYAAGIPTTEALAVLTTGRQVIRDLRPKRGAVLVRVAASHLRVGTFQFARSIGDFKILRHLADFSIERHYPELADSADRYLALLERVRDAQCQLVAGWMGLGFVHGVLNTDNVTISGETIDYGPCAYLDRADPSTVFSSIDEFGRYAYQNQPTITGWNLARFAETLLPLLNSDPDRAVELARGTLEDFDAAYRRAWAQVLRTKLAIADAPDDIAIQLGEELLALAGTETDFTELWRGLPTLPPQVDFAAGAGWLARWQAWKPNIESLNRVNPVHIPRNHLVQEALDAAEDGDLEPFEGLRNALTHPYAAAAAGDRYKHPAPTEFGAYTTYCGT